MIPFFLLFLTFFNFSFSNQLFDSNHTVFPQLSDDNEISQFFGYAPVDETNNKSPLFYWTIVHKEPSHNDLKSLPLVIIIVFLYVFWSNHWSITTLPSPQQIIWLNGGPSCSSLTGFFDEKIGPFSFESDSSAKLIENKFAWHRKLDAHVLVFDQPRGTGLSFLQRNNEKFPSTREQVRVWSIELLNK
jgi:hypothetical protein